MQEDEYAEYSKPLTYILYYNLNSITGKIVNSCGLVQSDQIISEGDW